MHTIEKGASVEALVRAFLELEDLTFIQQNYRCRLGEIDLIMLEPASNTLVFVEVRYRANALFGSASETVNPTKQRKLKRAVLHFLQKHANAQQRVRIDVMGVCNMSQESQAAKPKQLFGVSSHDFREYRLRWTRNAIEE